MVLASRKALQYRNIGWICRTRDKGERSVSLNQTNPKPGSPSLSFLPSTSHARVTCARCAQPSSSWPSGRSRLIGGIHEDARAPVAVSRPRRHGVACASARTSTAAVNHFATTFADTGRHIFRFRLRTATPSPHSCPLCTIRSAFRFLPASFAFFQLPHRRSCCGDACAPALGRPWPRCSSV